MKKDSNKMHESLGSRTQVTKNTKFNNLKDKLLFLGVILVCMGIGITSLMPKKSSNPIAEKKTKEDNSMQLNQTLALIATMKEKYPTLSNGYQGRDPKHPPHLRPISQKETLTKETLARMNAPSTFFIIKGGKSKNVSTSNLTNQDKTLIGQDPNAEFFNQNNEITSVLAKRLPHPHSTVPAGETIPATLETAINSELAGMARAVTTRDSYALTGGKLLIPKGSTLIGQFNTAITQGQSRIFVIWNRLQLTNGVIVTLNSPSSDSIGRSGLAADYINQHFLERFSSSALLSVLGAYTAMGGVHHQDEYNSLSQYRMNIAGSFQQAANQTLQQDMQTRPTLQVNQGTSITVFVAHDLDFYRLAGSIQ